VLFAFALANQLQTFQKKKKEAQPNLDACSYRRRIGELLFLNKNPAPLLSHLSSALVFFQKPRSRGKKKNDYGSLFRFSHTLYL
jgi:hypothetical protein